MNTNELKSEGKNLSDRKRSVIAGIGSLEKDGLNAHHNYRFISDIQIMKQVREKFEQQEISFHVEMPEAPILTQMQKGWHAVVHICVTLKHKEESEKIHWWGEAADTYDKAIQKAATSALKYLLMKIFLISGSDESDADSPDIGKPVAKENIDKKKSYDAVMNELVKSLKGSDNKHPILIDTAMRRWEATYKSGNLSDEYYRKGLAVIEEEHTRRENQNNGSPGIYL